MGSDRCPSCAAAVRPGADWCTLCYTDLRPAPAPVERTPYPRPSTPPAQLKATVSVDTAGPAADALHAPYEHVLAAVYGGADLPSAGLIDRPDSGSGTPPARPAGWPCSRCGELNDFERLDCSSCAAPFGAALRSGEAIPDRKKMMTYAVGGVLAFLLLVAALAFATTKLPPADGGTDVTPRGTTSAPAQPGAGAGGDQNQQPELNAQLTQ